MGLETGTYLDDLNTSNPSGGSDNISQGDDHLRLIKTVLKNTFPNADRAFRFPETVTKTAAYTVLATDMYKLIIVDTSSADVTITLPSVASVTAGDYVTIAKLDAANVVTVDTPGTEKIFNLDEFKLNQAHTFVRLISNGSRWLPESNALTHLNNTAADSMLYTTAVGTWGTVATTSVGRSLLGAADAAAIRTIAESLGAVVDDTTPQLGGDLDVNGNNLVDANGNDLLKFSAALSAVNELQITNAATGDRPKLSAVGSDTDIDLELSAKGTGNVYMADPLRVNGPAYLRKRAAADTDKTNYGQVWVHETDRQRLMLTDESGNDREIGAEHFIERQVASASSELDFTNFYPNVYENYVFDFANLTPATDNVALHALLSADNGVSFKTTSIYYYAGYNMYSSGSGSGWTSAGSDTEWAINRLGIGSAAGEDGFSGRLILFGPGAAKKTKCTWHYSQWYQGSQLEVAFGGGRIDDAVAHDGIRFKMSTGNIESGSITQYGLTIA